jgi:hypothetical protein
MSDEKEEQEQEEAEGVRRSEEEEEEGGRHVCPITRKNKRVCVCEGCNVMHQRRTKARGRTCMGNNPPTPG